jgi:Glycosyl transferases group 1
VHLQLRDRLAELPYRVRPCARARSLTWPLTESDLARIVITWPSRYEWPGTSPIVETLKDAFSHLGVLRVGPTPQTYKGVVMLACSIHGRAHLVALDYSDYPAFINRTALSESALYIKLEYRTEGYDDERIIPGGYTTTFCSYYRYYLPFRARYASERSIDVLGRFGYTFQPEIRRKAVEKLQAAADIHFVGSGGKVRYSRFLREVASARLSLHLPGNGPFTHRVAEFLGLGTCMMSVRYPTELHVPLVAGIHYVEIASDLADLVEKCRFYLRNEAERERIAKAGQEFFDRYLHCDQLAAYYIRNMLDRLQY